MSDFGHSTAKEAISFAHEHGIDLGADTRRLRWLPGRATNGTVKLVKFGGGVERHVTETGADYAFSQLDYFTGQEGYERLEASRMIAAILGGKRTELAYWTQAAPKKELTVHQGTGSLAVGNPADGKIKSFQLDADVTPSLTLPGGRFYTFSAHPWTPEPLVVSGFYEEETPVDWEAMEIPFEPGQATVEAPEGTIEIPPAFHDMFRRFGV